MKKYILIFIAILLPLTCLAGSIQDMHKAVIARRNVAGGALECTLLITQAVQDGYVWGSEGDNPNTCQKIDNNESTEICKVEIYPAHGDTNEYHVELWSDNVRAGTKYGNSELVELGTALTFHSFTFATNPEPPGDYFIHIILDSGSKVGIGTTTTVTSYLDTNYDLNTNGSDVDRDLTFKVWTMQ